MQKRNSAMFTFLLGSSLFASIAHASSLQTDISQLKQTYQQANNTMQTAIQKQQAANAKVASLQVSLTTISQQINTNNQQISQKTKQINLLNSKIVQNKKQLAYLQSDFNKQIRALYENGSVGYLSVLLHATSVSDFLNRFTDIKLITSANQKLASKVSSLKEQLTSQKQIVSTDLQLIQKKKSHLVMLQQTDQSLQSREKKQSKVLGNAIQSAQSKKNQIQQEIAFAKQELIDAQQHPIYNTAITPSAPTRQIKGNVSQMIKFAESFIGTPYVWGGTSPSGFDCSGFTQYVMRHFGVSIYRTSQSQFLEGTPVSYNNLQPGDLVFFTTYAAGATHVGIYIGSGLMVDAEDAGVRIDNIGDSYWGPLYLGARRVI